VDGVDACRGGGTPLLMGIARDAPGITPAAKIRFDCWVQFRPRSKPTASQLPATPRDHAIKHGVMDRDPRIDPESLRTCLRLTPSGRRQSRSTGRWLALDGSRAGDRHSRGDAWPATSASRPL
jgi:hypothetical protein